jgi:hypothetical protein
MQSCHKVGFFDTFGWHYQCVKSCRRADLEKNRRRSIGCQKMKMFGTFSAHAALI